MDEAFCRRLQVKFFVGRLDPEKRLELLLKLEEVELTDGKPFFCMNQHDLLKQLTTNFSGIKNVYFYLLKAYYLLVIKFIKF